MSAEIISFRSHARTADPPPSINTAEAAIPSNTRYVKVTNEVVSSTVTPTKTVPIEKLYPTIDTDKSFVDTVLKLLGEGEEKLAEARRLMQEDDAFGSDDAIQQFQAILPELFCCRSLGESFATLINVFFHSLKNLKGLPLNVEQMDTFYLSVSRLRASPFLSYNDALALIIQLENTGLKTEPEGLSVLEELLIG